MSTTQTASQITVAQAAEHLGVSERTVWRYIKSGRLTGETVGESGAQRTLLDAESVARVAAERGRDPQAQELRAERDALAERLREAEAERDALRGHLSALQVQHRPVSMVERVAALAFTLVERIPTRRPSASAS
jgi:excisionase family DNA binding protein